MFFLVVGAYSMLINFCSFFKVLSVSVMLFFFNVWCVVFSTLLLFSHLSFMCCFFHFPWFLPGVPSFSMHFPPFSHGFSPPTPLLLLPKQRLRVIPVTGQQGIRHEDQEAQGSLVPAMFVFLNYSYTAFWWFQSLWKILVNGKDYPTYYGKTKNVPNHQPDSYAISKLLLMAKLC